MSNFETWAVALVSGAIGALLSQCLAIWHASRLEKRRESEQIRQVKLEVLRKLAGNRGAATGKAMNPHTAAFYEALNEIMVVYSGSPEVVAALKSHHESLGTNSQPDCLVTLFKAMCKDTGVDLSAFNDRVFLSPYNPKLP